MGLKFGKDKEHSDETATLMGSYLQILIDTKILQFLGEILIKHILIKASVSKTRQQERF